MKIKVCGMRDADNIREIEKLGIDLMGFIFYPKSSRYVSIVPQYLPQQCERVGVFVNESTSAIIEKAKLFGLNYIQMHGNETSEQCAELKWAGYKVIKAFSIESEKDFEQIHGSYESICDYLLFDSKCDSYGGSGKQFDWTLLNSYQGSLPFFISGGINAKSDVSLNQFSHPLFQGIDINSQFESSPAIKDAGLIKSFISKIKNR